MLRPMIPADSPTLQQITVGTGYFKPHEIETLQRVLDDEYPTIGRVEGHVCRTFERDGDILGFVYYGPVPITVGTWELWWIVVKKDVQGLGLGGEMLRAVEDDARRNGGRALFVDTGSLPLYQSTHRFYLKHGYEKHTVLKDYYAPGDSKTIFRKEL